jgi:alkanesulfonate monooxygenase SsuD/methylene tetrahydromethanopterin reductase-like flavin-dependent oxidoreductase (luciferase family)
MTTSAPEVARAPAGQPARFPLVLGLDTFGDVTHDDEDRPLSHAQTIRDLVEQGVLADQVGVDYFGIGEHHTDDFPLSAGDVVLAAISSGRAEVILGRGSSIDSFPLFGYDLADYEEPSKKRPTCSPSS